MEHISVSPLKIVSRAYKMDRLAHAYLLAGGNETLRAHTLRELATLLLCVSPTEQNEKDKNSSLLACKRCTGCQKVKKGIHPDLIEISPRGTFIRIEQIRELQEQIRFSPLEGKRRVVVINQVERMNPSAANALLKLLEEPPTHTHLFLSSGNISALLPTIVSRCQVLRLSAISFSDEFVFEISSKIGREPLGFLRFLVEDLSIQDEEGLSLAFEIRDRIVEFLASENRSLSFIETGSFLWNSPDRVKLALEVVRTLARDLLFIWGKTPEKPDQKRDGQNLLMHQDIAPLLGQLAERTNYDTLVSYEKTVSRARKMSERNVKPEMIADMILVFWLKT